MRRLFFDTDPEELRGQFVLNPPELRREEVLRDGLDALHKGGLLSHTLVLRYRVRSSFLYLKAWQNLTVVNNKYIYHEE